MKELIIVDGYNVINALSRYRESAKLSLEAARVRLIEDMVNFKAISNCEVIVVFDSSMVKWDLSEEELFGIKVIFSGKGKTADSVIEEIVSKYEGEEKLIVVTSDYVQQRFVFGKGVMRRTPKELEVELVREQTSLEKTHENTRVYLEEWIPKEVKEKLRKLMREL